VVVVALLSATARAKMGKKILPSVNAGNEFFVSSRGFPVCNLWLLWLLWLILLLVFPVGPFLPMKKSAQRDEKLHCSKHCQPDPGPKHLWRPDKVFLVLKKVYTCRYRYKYSLNNRKQKQKILIQNLKLQIILHQYMLHLQSDSRARTPKFHGSPRKCRPR